MSRPPGASAIRRALPRIAALALFAFVLAACQGYYPTWHYAPRVEVHALHISANGANTNADPDVRISVELIGILRPENGGPRRLHVRFDVDDCGSQAIVFKTAQTTATPNGGAPLTPDAILADVDLTAGSRRSFELFFALPDPTTLSNQALEQIDLAWTVAIGGVLHPSRTTFRRQEYYDPGPYWYGDPYWYGPIYWSDPYWHYGYYGHCGYGYGYHHY